MAPGRPRSGHRVLGLRDGGAAGLGPGRVQALLDPLASHLVGRGWQTAAGGHFASWFVLLEMARVNRPLDSSGAGHAEGEGRWLSSLQAQSTSAFFPLDSGYLFSGSRPPSQVSRSGEVPLSGKENREPRGVTGRLRRVGAACRPGFLGRCVGRTRERLSMSFGVKWASVQIPTPCSPLRSPGRVTNTLSLSFSCEMGVSGSFSYLPQCCRPEL